MKKVAVLFLIIFSCQCSADWGWVICCIPLFKRLSTWCSSCRTSTEQQSKSIGINCDDSTSSRDSQILQATQQNASSQATQQSASSPVAQQSASSPVAQQNANNNHLNEPTSSQFNRLSSSFSLAVTEYPSSSNSSRIYLSIESLLERRDQNELYRQGYSDENLLSESGRGDYSRSRHPHSCDNLISGSNQVGRSGFYQSSRYAQSYDYLEHRPTHPCHSNHNLRRQQTRTRSASHLNNQQLRAISSSYRRMETQV